MSVFYLLKSCPTLKSPWTVADPAPLFLGFPWQEYQGGMWSVDACKKCPWRHRCWSQSSFSPSLIKRCWPSCVPSLSPFFSSEKADPTFKVWGDATQEGKLLGRGMCLVRSHSENNCDFPGQLLKLRMAPRPCGRAGQKQDAVSRCQIEQTETQVLVRF